MSLQEKYENVVDELKSNPVRYIKSFAMDIVVVIVAVAYVLYQMVRLETTNINPLILIAQALMGIICGVVIKAALGENGFSKGYNSDFYRGEEEKYNNACNVALPYMDRVDNFYQYEEIDKKKKYRLQHLQSVRLKYEMWFNENGDYIGDIEKYKALDRKQKFVLNKCIKVKIYVLNLFGQYEISSDQDTKKEITDRAQRGKNITKNTLSATLIAIIGVYFVPVLNAWSWASFFSSTLQVAMWVLFGVLQLYTNYNFVVQDKVSVMRKKKEDIKRFTSGCEKGLYLVSPYEKVVAPIEPKAEIDQDFIEKLMSQPITQTPSLEPKIEPIDNSQH